MGRRPGASLLIGLLLTTVAVFLARESKGLLIGESADPEIVASIREAAESDPDVPARARTSAGLERRQQHFANVDARNACHAGRPRGI